MKMITNNKIIIYSSSVIVSILVFISGYALGNHNSHNNKVINTIKNLSKSSIPSKNNIYGINVGNIIVTAQINTIDSQVISVSTASGNQYTFNINKGTSVFINNKKASVSDLTKNNIIRIIGNVQKDGVLVATNVQLISK